jgi:iron complex outermembrane receptor protein
LLPSQTKLNIAATLLHAKFVDGKAVDASTGIEVPLKGYTLPNAPTVSLTAGVEQPWLLGNGAKLTARLNGKYQSKTYFSIFDHPDVEQGSYATGDASLTFTAPSTKWNVQGYVHNFTDKAVLANAGRNGVVAANNYEFTPPRTFGVKLALSW